MEVTQSIKWLKSIKTLNLSGKTKENKVGNNLLLESINNLANSLEAVQTMRDLILNRKINRQLRN